MRLFPQAQHFLHTDLTDVWVHVLFLLLDSELFEGMDDSYNPALLKTPSMHSMNDK